MCRVCSRMRSYTPKMEKNAVSVKTMSVLDITNSKGTDKHGRSVLDYIFQSAMYARDRQFTDWDLQMYMAQYPDKAIVTYGDRGQPLDVLAQYLIRSYIYQHNRAIGKGKRSVQHPERYAPRKAQKRHYDYDPDWGMKRLKL